MIALIRRFKLWQRFAALGFLGLLSVAVPATLYLVEAYKAVDTAATEQRGVPVAAALVSAIRAVQAHRGLAVAVVRGAGATPAQRETGAVAVDKAMQELVRLVADGQTSAAVKKSIGSIASEWSALLAGIVAGKLDVKSVREGHNAIIDHLSRSLELAADEYGLTLDPEAASWHLIMASLVYMPQLSEPMGGLRAQGADVWEDKAVPMNAKLAAAALLDRTRQMQRLADGHFRKALAADPVLAQSMAPLIDDAARQSNEALNLTTALFVNEERSGSVGTYRAKMSQAIDAQFKLVGASAGELEKMLEGRVSTIRARIHLLAGFIALIATLAVLLGVLMASSLLGPISDAVRMADALARGEFSGNAASNGSDEAGQLLSSIANVQSVLARFAAAQDEMKARHNAGEISYRIDVSGFGGSYGQLVQSTNELVESHTALTARVVDVITGYADGNLSLDMDRLSGEKARITEAMDGVKASLTAISAQIQTLVDAARRGDFSERGDETRFNFEFRKMVAGLNQLMQTSDKGLSEVSRVLDALASGDLTERMSGDHEGTFAQLQLACNKTVENLTEIVDQIKASSESINTASREISHGNTDLSQRTEEQASALEQTASSMETITTTVKQNAENARQANQLAVGASAVAVKGGNVVKQVVGTMTGISDSSKKIAAIIGTIDGIAFQTNILALNAAVEAARAGEQGRGFAVVATEVRNLAQRSAAAAKEIKELITDSVSKVDAGTQLVDEAGKTMDEIVTSVKRVTDIMAEITAATLEQSQGIEQVNQAITQMDEGTQQNAALVEQAAAAAESMQEQAGALVHAVATFKLAGHAAGARRIERRGPGRATNVARLPERARASR